MGNAEYMGVRRLFDIMKVIAAYMFVVTGGNATPNVADCKKIFSAVGVNVTEDEEKRLEDLVEEMAGGSLEETFKKGYELLKTVPGGSGGGAALVGGAAPAAGGEAAAEAKKSSSDDDDDAGMAGAGLFGEDGGDDY